MKYCASSVRINYLTLTAQAALPRHSLMSFAGRQLLFASSSTACPEPAYRCQPLNPYRIALSLSAVFVAASPAPVACPLPIPPRLSGRVLRSSERTSPVARRSALCTIGAGTSARALALHYRVAFIRRGVVSLPPLNRRFHLTGPLGASAATFQRVRYSSRERYASLGSRADTASGAVLPVRFRPSPSGGYCRGPMLIAFGGSSGPYHPHAA